MDKQNNKNSSVKKPIFKKWWFWVIVIVVLGTLGSLGNINDYSAPQTESQVYNNQADNVQNAVEQKLSFQLVGGETGEYGTYVMFNEGTEFEERVIEYHIPAGTYKVTNKGQYMEQVSIYSDEKHITEGGWEEPAESFGTILIDSGKFNTISIEDGQYIEVTASALLGFEMQ